MQEYKNITGGQLLDLFYKLIQDQTLLKISLPENDFESLTVLTDIDTKNNSQLLQIDMPEGLLPLMQNASARKMNFEFTGENQLTHRFEAEIQKINEKSIWLDWPSVVQRFQMRNNFRIKVHQDSYATLDVNDSQVRMEIDNISIGGVYCYCLNLHKSSLLVDNLYENMELIITGKEECYSVQIDQVTVKRIEQWMRPKHFGIAFEFVKIQKSTRQQLIRQIYSLQRDFLKSRLNPDV